MASALEAHAKPPNGIRELYKQHQKQTKSALSVDASIIQSLDGPSSFRLLELPCYTREIFLNFLGQSSHAALAESSTPVRPYEIPHVPGLIVYPSLFPPSVQLSMLDKLLLRELSSPQHQTNVHMHYNITYPSASFFDPAALGLTFAPKNSSIHQSISVQNFLTKKLRWMTLGGQYDWTNKVYPPEKPPPFPSDLKKLIGSLFPVTAEAAIVNLYQPGDTLSMHRDISEPTQHIRPLVSISLGCDAIFIAGLEGEGKDGESRVATIRLRSGDAVLMSGESRYAWHGVPKVLEDTCPEWMQPWPYRIDSDGAEKYKEWMGWAKGKRINLNVRQMFD